MNEPSDAHLSWLDKSSSRIRRIHLSKGRVVVIPSRRTPLEKVTHWCPRSKLTIRGCSSVRLCPITLPSNAYTTLCGSTRNKLSSSIYDGNILRSQLRSSLKLAFTPFFISILSQLCGQCSVRTWRDGFRRESSCGTKRSLGRSMDGRLPLTTANGSSQPVLQRVRKNYSAVHVQAGQGPMHDTLQRLLPFHSSRLLSSSSLSITPCPSRMILSMAASLVTSEQGHIRDPVHLFLFVLHSTLSPDTCLEPQCFQSRHRNATAPYMMYLVPRRPHKLSNDVSVDEPLEGADPSLWRCTVSALPVVHSLVGNIFHAMCGGIVYCGPPIPRTSWMRTFHYFPPIYKPQAALGNFVLPTHCSYGPIKLRPDNRTTHPQREKCV